MAPVAGQQICTGPPKSGALGALTPRLVPRPGAPKAARLRHHSEVPSKEVPVLAALPIWLGTSSLPPVQLQSIQAVVPEDWHHEDALSIDEAESDASFCSTHERFVEAAEHLEQAISIRQQLLGDEHQEFLTSIEHYVVCCNNWALRSLGGDFTSALELLKKAEAMTEADNVPNYPRRLVLRAVTFSNLCSYYRSRGKQNAALQFAERCLKIQRQYREADSPARSHLNYAVLLSSQGRHTEALENIERALAILHDLERDAIATEDTAQMLVVSHYNMFVEHLRLKQSETSLQSLQRAVMVAVQKLGESHVLTQKMREVQCDAQERQEQKASSQRFRTQTALELAPLFHYQDDKAHPWQKVNLDDADSERAQEILSHTRQITLRRRRPPIEAPPPPEKPPPRSRGLRHLKLQQAVYGKVPVLGAEVTARWWQTRPKLLDSDGFAGSPILCQQAHGVQPMLQRLERRQQEPGEPARLAEPQEASLQPLKQDLVPVPPGAPPEVAAAAEYHHRRLQMQGAVTALEPERMRAIMVLRDRLDKRREKGLPTPTDCKQHQAATKIQARIRGFLVRQWSVKELAREMRRQRALQESSGGVDAKRQAAFQVIYAARRVFVEYNAAVFIQKTVRGSMTRNKLQRQISQIAHASAVKVQALARGCLVRAKQRRKGAAAKRIQAAVRRMFAIRRVTKIRHLNRQANKLARGFLARHGLRRQHQAATQIQRHVRGGRQRGWLARQQAAAVQLQRVARGISARRRVARMQGASGCIGARWRGTVERRRLTQQRARAVQIQAAYRGILERRWFLRLQRMVKRLHLLGGKEGGHIFSGMSMLARIHNRTANFFQRRRLWSRTLEAIHIQRVVRGYLARSRQKRQQEATRRIQALQRGLSLRRRMQVKVLAAVRVQAFLRCKRAVFVKESRAQAARKIQAMRRGMAVRRRLKRQQWAVKRIQAWLRDVRASRRSTGGAKSGEVLAKSGSNGSLDTSDALWIPVHDTLRHVLALDRLTPSDLECDDSRPASLDFSLEDRLREDSLEIQDTVCTEEAALLDELQPEVSQQTQSQQTLEEASQEEAPAHFTSSQLEAFLDEPSVQSSVQEDEWHAEDAGFLMRMEKEWFEEPGLLPSGPEEASMSSAEMDEAALSDSRVIPGEVLADPTTMQSGDEASAGEASAVHSNPGEALATEPSVMQSGAEEVPQASVGEPSVMQSNPGEALCEPSIGPEEGRDGNFRLEDTVADEALLAEWQPVESQQTSLLEASQEEGHLTSTQLEALDAPSVMQSSLAEDDASLADCPQIIISDALADLAEEDKSVCCLGSSLRSAMEPLSPKSEGLADVLDASQDDASLADCPQILISDALADLAEEDKSVCCLGSSLHSAMDPLSPKSEGLADVLDASQDSHWLSNCLVTEVLEDAEETHEAPQNAAPAEEVADAELLAELQEALLEDPTSLPSAHVEATGSEAQDLEGEADAAVGGILTSLTVRSTPASDFSGTANSEVLEVLRSIHGESLAGDTVEDLMRACETSHAAELPCSPGSGAAAHSMTGIEDVGPSIEDLGTAEDSLMEIHQEVEEMVPQA